MTVAASVMGTRHWRTARREIALDRALVVGILNITPDSFSDGGRHFAAADAVRAAHQMKEQGADLLDIGGESTRPGAVMPSAEEESRRIVPVIEQVAAEVGLPLSVDTRRAAVARAAVAAGAEIVNDVSGLAFDAMMAEVVAEVRAGVIIMHMRGNPGTMDSLATYGDVVSEVVQELEHARTLARSYAIADDCIVLDPGLGFAKKAEHNLEIIARLDEITALGYPVMVGPSRKRFLGTVTGKALNERDAATAAACVAARMKGASLFRVHDVASAKEALMVADAVLSHAPRPTPHAPHV